MDFQIPLEFINDSTRAFFSETKKNSCICGGFGSGKTYIACYKALMLCTSFSKYRMVIARQTFKDLKQTTLKTFLKICPESLIARWNEQDGYMKLINGSEILWMHLDNVSEGTLRGLEVNSAFIDQAEEVSESIADVLDARCGRWEKAIPQPAMQHLYPKDRFGNFTGIPSYFMLDCNPESETHWIYNRYHPDSPEHLRWNATHAYFEVASTDNPYLNPETLRTMLSRDPAWVKRFVKGQWGIGEATIHVILPESMLEVNSDFIRNLLKKANLYRSFDHGDSSPACCLWWAAYKNQHFCYREYYQGNTTISGHRANIADLSDGETYLANWADPSIFKHGVQKLGGHWKVADEYTDRALDSPPISWQPADNNELATRNRINELLAIDPNMVHPVTAQKGAPRLYFIRRSSSHAYGCEQAILQTRSQRREKLGENNGRPIYHDERDDAITDHAYDPVRYYVSGHARGGAVPRKIAAENSFYGIQKRLKMLRQVKYEQVAHRA